MARPKSNMPPKSNHSMRVEDRVWEAADKRAKRDGTNLNAALGELLEGYAHGYIHLPKITKSYVSVNATPEA